MTDFGVWSLVFQLIAKQLIYSILIWFRSKWRPSAGFSYSAFKDLFGFGSKILGSHLIVTFQNNIYYLVIGKFFSAASLGYFTRAEQFNSIVTSNITGSIERVFFPVLSSMQEDETRMKSTLKKMVCTSFFITYISLIGLAIIAKPLIHVLVGPLWNQSVLYLQLICVGSVFFPFNAVNLNILKVKGRSDLILRLQLIKTVLTALVVICGIIWGIVIMLTVRIFTVMFATYINSQYSGQLISYPFKEQISDILKYFWSESLILIVIFLLSFLPLSYLIILFLQIVIGAGLFFMVFERLKHSEYLEIKSMIKDAIKIRLYGRNILNNFNEDN